MVTLSDGFSERYSKAKSNVTSDLNEYFNDINEWKENSLDLVEYGIFYSDACSNWLEAVLLYQYPMEKYGREYLLSKPGAGLNTEEFEKHHNLILRNYYIDRVLVKWLCDEVIDNHLLHESTVWYDSILKSYGYSDSLEAIDELDADSIFIVFIPQMIINKYLGVDFPAVMQKIDGNLKSDEKIWLCAWEFFRVLYNDDKEKIVGSWKALLLEWKYCYIRADFHAFSITYLVLIYDLYCQCLGKKFVISELSTSIKL